MGNDLYAPHGTANRNGRSPATRAARELRDVGGRGGDRGPRRGPLGCLGGVRQAAALGRRCRRGLHRGRERPQRCVRPGNGPGEPSGTPAPRRGGERRRGEVVRGLRLYHRGEPCRPRERLGLRDRPCEHRAHGVLRGGPEVSRRARESRDRLPGRIVVPLRRCERLPVVDRAARPDGHLGRSGVLHHDRPRDHQRHRGHARRRRPPDSSPSHRVASRGFRRGDCLVRRSGLKSRPLRPRGPVPRVRDPRDQEGGESPRDPVPRECGEPVAARGCAVLHEPPEQPRPAPHRGRAAPRRPDREGLGTRGDPDGLLGRRAGDAGRGGRRRRADLPQEPDRRGPVRPGRPDARHEARISRGGKRRAGTGPGPGHPGRAGRDRHPSRRRRRHPHAGGRPGRDPGGRGHRRDGHDRRGGPRRRGLTPDHRSGEGGLMHVFRAKTAGESHAETTRIARRLFVSPAPRRIVPAILAFSVMEAYLLVYPALDGVRVLLGGVAIGVPALLAAFGTVPLANRLGGRMYFRRSFLLAFVGLMLLGAFQLVAVLALTMYSLFSGVPYPDRIHRVAVLGYGAMLWTREVILSATSNSKHLRSLPAASLQPLLRLVRLALFVPLLPDGLVLALVVFASFFASAVAYTEIAKRPLLRSFGVDGLKLLRSTLDHYTEPEASGIAELETFFDSMSVRARVRVGGLAFRVGSRLKALFVAPTVHPGPMGYVSGSDLPTKIARDLSDLTLNVMVAHGPTTHDENPATTAEVRKVAEAVRASTGSATFGARVGQARRTTYGRAAALAQAFGDVVLIVASFAPQPTDDIDSATGYAAVQEARLQGARDAVFVDAHNCLEPGVGLTLFGSHRSHEIIEAAKSATQAALAAPKAPFRVGYANRKGFSTPDQGIGARGIEALVVETGGQTTAYVLFGGDDIDAGLRDET